jgi:hypothetical protein
MGWIKRNLLFVVISLVALVSLGAAGFYIYKGYTANSDKSEQLNGIYAKLQELAGEQPQPGNDKINNTETAKQQEQQLRDWIRNASGHFRTVPPIPEGDVTSKTFATALGNTIYQLQKDAKENSVGLPSQYNFSFQVQNGLLTISSGLGPLAQQLGEVQAITEILLGAQVNNLDGIQRVRVSEDDVIKGVQSDYTDKVPITNELGIITPYVVTFRCFTPELAAVIASFANSTNPFVVKSVTVQLANAEAGAPDNTAGTPTMMPPQNVANLRYWRMRGGYPGAGYPGGPGMPPAQPQPNAPVPGKGGLQAVLKEQLLRVTMEVDIVKLLPKS